MCVQDNFCHHVQVRSNGKQVSSSRSTFRLTFSELSQGERGLDVLHAGGLEGLRVVGHDVGVEGVDKMAHDMDEDPVGPNSMLPSHLIKTEEHIQL